jgi:Immunoglobulin domain
VVNFTTPFVYNPSSGNLLVDIQDFSGEATSYTDEEGSTGDLASRVSGAGGGSTSGTPDTGCAVLEIIYTLTNQPPMIVLEPTNQTAVLGSSATFNVGVTGSQPFNYQWYYNGTNGIMGATNAALTLTDVQLTNAGEYSVTVSNFYGVTKSSEALLTVTNSGAFVVPVGLANVEGSGSSANLTYDVREQDVYGASYFPTQTIVITGIRFRPTVNGGGQAFTNTISNIQFSLSSTTNSADQLSSIFSDNIGTNVTTVFSGSLPLSSRYAGPASGPKAFDMVVNFTTPFVYNPSSGNLLLDIQDFSGETTSYTDGQNSPSDLGSRVSAVGASSTSGTPDSSCAVLEIAYTVANQPPMIVTQPTNQTVLVGGPGAFNVSATGSPLLNYQWYWNGTNVLTGATNAALTLNDVQLTNAGEYSVTVSNLYGGTNSSEALLTVNDFLDHFIWSQISSTQFVNGPFTVTVQAQDPNNELFTNFTGAVNLTSTNGIVVNPDISQNFIQGTWTGSITISQTASNLVLQANNGLGKTGLSNPINIISPPNLTTVREGGLLLIFWPVTPSGFVLETSGSLSPPEWVQVSSPPLQIGDQNLISVGISDTNSFYRLQFSSP